MRVEDVLQEIAKLKSNDKEPEFLVIHPNSLYDLLRSDRFFSLDQLSHPIRDGEIGRIFGIPVVISNQIKPETAILCPRGFNYKEILVRKEFNPSRRDS